MRGFLDVGVLATAALIGVTRLAGTRALHVPRVYSATHPGATLSLTRTIDRPRIHSSVLRPPCDWIP